MDTGRDISVPSLSPSRCLGTLISYTRCNEEAFFYVSCERATLIPDEKSEEADVRIAHYQLSYNNNMYKALHPSFISRKIFN